MNVPIQDPRKLTLPNVVWLRVAGFLRVNEMLGLMGQLSVGCVALLGDERCWTTLALPPGPQRLSRLLNLMMVEEHDLWRWPLCQVQFLDLDLAGCSWMCVENFKKLIFTGLDLGSTLCSVKVRRIPVRAPDGSMDPAERLFKGKVTRDLIRKVNPVIPSAPAAPVVFLLAPAELGRLRVLMAGFRSFHLAPSKDCNGAWQSTLDLIAQRQPQISDPQPETVCKPFQEEDPAEKMLLDEVGDLKFLPSCEDMWMCQHFSSWCNTLLRSYRVVLAAR